MKKSQGTIKIFLAKFLTTYVLILIEKKFHSDLLYIGQTLINLRKEVFNDP